MERLLEVQDQSRLYTGVQVSLVYRMRKEQKGKKERRRKKGREKGRLRSLPGAVAAQS